jgi:hypothetical protein
MTGSTGSTASTASTASTDLRPAPPVRGPAVPAWTPRSGSGASTTSGIHSVLGWIYGALGGLVVVIFIGTLSRSRPGAEGLLVLLALVPAAMHLGLAWGARRRMAWARVGSSLVGVLMLFGFPIGTVIGYFLLKAAGGNWDPTPKPLEVHADLRG